MILGIKALHDELFVHRDIKQNNILLTSGNEVRIADFGTCILNRFATNDPYDIEGTPAFVAPELFFIKEVDFFANDIWALGICFLELLTLDSVSRDSKDILIISKIFSVFGTPSQTFFPKLYHAPYFQHLKFCIPQYLKPKSF